MSPSEANILKAVLDAATPFIRIEDAAREDWCRVMRKENDGRIGPWKYNASYVILDQRVWDRPGEVIYFVTNKEGILRLVGQSMSKLNGRWKKAPMYDVESKRALGKKALFHTSSWPAIEAGFMSSERPPFVVSALFRQHLEPLCKSLGGPLHHALSIPETHRHRLSYYVETWVCSLNFVQNRLWNKQKVVPQ